MPEAGGPVDAMMVWTESNRDGTAGVAPQATQLQPKLTVIYGPMRCLTDQYVGTPTAGVKLFANANGKLEDVAATGNDPVAVCTKAEHALTRSWEDDTNVIEIFTI